MKIGLYTVDVPANLGGGYVFRDDLARFATSFQGRHQFELVTTPPEDPPPPAKTWLQSKWDRFRKVPLPVRRSEEQRLQDLLTGRKFDLLWFNHITPIFTDVPYVINVWDMQHRLQPWFPEVSQKGEWKFRETVWADAARRAAIITVGSQEAKEQLCHFYGLPLENVHVLPFPTPERALDIARGNVGVPARTDVRGKYGIKGDFLFYPAQFWPHKNHANLLYALKLLRQRGREISLALTGADHGNFDYLKTMAQTLGIDDLVHFCGFVPYEDILTFYREARALSYVSYFGPENLPPLEAMALECPVILSDIPGVRTLHGDGPVLVKPRDPASIADGIAFILDHPDQVRDRIRDAKAVALRNDYARYFENFQSVLDDFAPVRRSWPSV